MHPVLVLGGGLLDQVLFGPFGWLLEMSPSAAMTVEMGFPLCCLIRVVVPFAQLCALGHSLHALDSVHFAHCVPCLLTGERHWHIVAH